MKILQVIISDLVYFAYLMLRNFIPIMNQIVVYSMVAFRK